MNTKSSSNLVNPLTNKSFQQVLINKLKPYEKNARKHSAVQIDKLANIISQLGMITPLIIDSKYNILAGHGRLEAARKLGFKTVPTVCVEHLTEHQKRAFIIADNKLAELSEWDEDLLKMEFKDLVIAELDFDLGFDLAITGFETAEIDKLTSVPKPMDNVEKIADLDNALIAAIEKPAISQIGDIWLLGNQKILCGDATKAESYKKLIGKDKISLLCADAPYNVKIDGFASGNGVKKHKEFKQAAGEMSVQQFIEFLYLFIYHSSDYLQDGALAYLFMDWRHNIEIQAAASKAGLKHLNLCIWDKESGGMGSMYRSQHELVFVYKHGSKPHTNNIMLGKHGRYRTNVWPHPGAIRTEEGRKALQGHPTPKPVPLVMDILKDATKTKDIVLDPFLGSGTSVLAAEKTNRRCFGIELDPHYVDLAIRRWQELTGKQAIHSQTGDSFADHEQGTVAKKAKVVRDR